MPFDEDDLRVAVIDIFEEFDDHVPARRIAGVWRDSRVVPLEMQHASRVIRTSRIARNVRERIAAERRPPANRIPDEVVARARALDGLYLRSEIAELLGVCPESITRRLGKLPPRQRAPKPPPRPRAPKAPRKPRPSRPVVVARCPFCLATVTSRDGSHDCVEIDNRPRRAG